MKKRILLAEDHVETRKIVGLVLAEDEFELLEASNGLQTLQLVKEHNPDLLLLDLMMPNMDGIEVCRRLREDANTRSIKIVALTALSGPNDRFLAEEAGVDGYVTKPFRPSKLLATIRQMLETAPRTDAEAVPVAVNRLT